MEQFLKVLERLKGERTINQFALDTGISQTYMRKIFLGEVYPSKKIINRILTSDKHKQTIKTPTENELASLLNKRTAITVSELRELLNKCDDNDKIIISTEDERYKITGIRKRTILSSASNYVEIKIA